MKNNRLTLLLFAFLSSHLIVKAQANLEVITPTGCETGSCSVDFPNNPIEAGLDDLTTVTIMNNNTGGGADLSGSFSIVSFTGSTSCPECAYFSFPGGVTTFSLAAGATQDIDILFSPPFNIETVGGISVKLRITANNDAPACVPPTCDPAEGLPDYPDADLGTSELDVDININAVIQKTVINYSLVLDRSGSMNFVEGTDLMGDPIRRIDLLSNAVDYFLSLEQLRKQDLPQFEGDSIGIVKFNNTVDAAYLPIAPIIDDGVTNFIDDEARPLINEAATNDPNLIQPMFGTATGNAVIASINDHFTDPAPSPRKKVIILMSDGFENTGPLVGDPAVTNLLAARQDVNIYSIGMGSANMVSLEQYSNLSGLATPQAYYVDPSTDLLMMDNFFLNIYKDAVGLTSISDPTYNVTFNDSTEVQIAEVWITSAEGKVLFTITHPSNLRQFVDFRLINPAGNVLSEGLVNGLNTVKIEGGNHVVYETTITEDAPETEYVGKWTLKGSNLYVQGDEESERTEGTPNLSNVPVSFNVAGLSNLTFDFVVEDSEPGEDLVVTAEFDDSSSGDEEPEVEEFEVEITKPDGEIIRTKPIRDKFGTYVATYPHTQKEGIYSIYARAVVKTAKGERATRDAFRQVVISSKQSFVSEDQPCLPCKWIKIVIVIALVLLLFILILTLRRRSR